MTQCHAELAGGYKTYDFNSTSGLPDRDVWSVLGGLYYEPVAQLTIGLEAEYTDTTQDHYAALVPIIMNNTTVDLVTVFRF